MFSARLGENLLQLQEELRSQSWMPAPYRERMIFEPKQRTIRIAPFRDRIVHQAVCEVFAPFFEETFIFDNYACRVGKGSYAAVDRLTAFLRKPGNIYVLKGDIRKYFDSIPHGLIMRALEWRIRDAAMLGILRRILESYENEEATDEFGPRGLPIGNLTSQWFANIVGDYLDQHVKHVLKCRYYLRYMDDFLLIADDKTILRDWWVAIEKLLAEMGLALNPKTRILRATEGVPFLGFRVWADHRRVLRQNIVRGKRKMRENREAVRHGTMARAAYKKSFESWMAHLSHADTYLLRRKLQLEFG